MALTLILGELALALLSAVAHLPLEQSLAVLVDLELGDDNLGGVDTDVDGGAVHLLAGDALDVDHPLLAVHLDNLARATFEATPRDSHLVILADGHSANLDGSDGEENQEKVSVDSGRKGEGECAVRGLLGAAGASRPPRDGRVFRDKP